MPSRRCAQWPGTAVIWSSGLPPARSPELPLNLVLLKNCDIRGVAWGAWVTRAPHKQRELMRDIVMWAAQGKLSAHVHATYPLPDIASALKAIADRKVMGKIVLHP